MNNQDTSSSPTEPPSQSNSLAEEPPALSVAEALPPNHCSTIVFINGASFQNPFIKFKISGGNHVRFF
jgi:hypothetical protein